MPDIKNTSNQTICLNRAICGVATECKDLAAIGELIVAANRKAIVQIIIVRSRENEE